MLCKLYTGFFFLLLLLIFCPGTAHSQRQAAADILVNPLLDERLNLPDGEVRSFNSFGGWGGFGHYLFSSDDHHLWFQNLGGYAELWRQGDFASMLLTGQIRFIADPHNNINFNPRAIFWEEGFLYTSRIDPGYVQIGFMHRCKHDIDNLNIGQERSLIFSSFMARYQQPGNLLTPNDLMMMIGFEQYVITWDRRDPRNLEEHQPNWNDLRNELTLHVQWYPDTGSGNLFAESRMHIVNLDRQLYFNRGASAGWRIERPGGEFRIELSYEYFHDSGIPAVPADVHLLGIGIRANSPFVIR